TLKIIPVIIIIPRDLYDNLIIRVKILIPIMCQITKILIPILIEVISTIVDTMGIPIGISHKIPILKIGDGIQCQIEILTKVIPYMGVII
ncbi:MAG TPA: hypothetical protein VEQ18_05905, partial [Candidatus Nitrosocosmicus sp.]|nr:hypothetical protein [Candidatus Nitrosocosmicus sp.]